MKKILLTLLLSILAYTADAQWRSLGEYNKTVTYYQKVDHTEWLKTSIWIRKEGVVSNLLFDCRIPRIRYVSASKNNILLNTTKRWIDVPFNNGYATWLWAKACSLPSD